MQRKNLMFGGSAVLTAAIAIGAGVMVSSGAMAASSGAPTDAKVSMVSVGTDGQAVKCEFPANELPAPSGVPAGADGVITHAVAITATGGMLDAPPPGPGVRVISGTASTNGDTTAIQINPDGSTSDMVVRDGTAKECSDLLHDATTAAGAPGTVTVTGQASTDVSNP